MTETGLPGPFEPDLVSASGGKWRRMQSQPLHFWSGFYTFFIISVSKQRM